MGRQKKNEIDSVLEQLKKSYADSIDDELEDSLLESEKSEEDTELSAILEKIFSTNKDSEDSAPESADAEGDAALSSERGEEIIPQEKTEIELSESEDDLKSRQVSESKSEEPPVSNEEIEKTEEERVDDVLRAMFGGGQSQDSNDGISAEDFPVSLDSSNKDEQIIQADISYTQDLHSDDTSDQVSTPLSEYNEPVVNAQQDDNDFIAEEEACVDETDADDVPETAESSSKILDPQEYISAPLQTSTSCLSFFKPEKDLDFSNAFDEIHDQKSTGTQDNISEIKPEITDKDISLLMKFGYDSEICTGGQSGHANTVIFDNSKKYVPEKHKIIHGYIGKEFSSKSQIPEIKKKYKIDRSFLLIWAILVSIITFVVITLDITSLFSHVDSNVQLSFYLIASLLVGLLLINKIYYGASSLIKFDANEYSMPAIILIENVVCTLILYIIFHLVEDASFLPFGGYAFIYVTLAVWAEYIDCIREMNTFAFLTGSETHYVAEKRSYEDNSESENVFKSGTINRASEKYIIKQSNFISGYYRKITEGKSEKINTMIILGILPILSVILGLTNVFLNDSVTFGVNIASYVLFLSVPISSVISLSVINYVNYIRFKQKGCTVIGQNSVENLSNAESLIFEDTDVIEIVSCTEINPETGSDKSKKWLNIARNVFSSLGGPLAKAITSVADNGSNVSHDVSINSISDNGVDIYFDSSMNILIGDRRYMLSHGIKVKTDVNLTGAVTGTDRSVIYMAFDRIPKIGFIISSKVKDSFVSTLEILKNSGINVEVKTYEPQINEYFFESNNIEIPISIIKPSNFELIAPSNVSDSNIVSIGLNELCRALECSRQASKEYHTHKKIKKIQSIIGFISACVLALLSFLPSSLIAQSELHFAIQLSFYSISLLMVIPNVIQIIKILKRK